MDIVCAISMCFLTLWWLSAMTGGEQVTLNRLQKLQQLRRTFRTRPADDDNWNYTSSLNFKIPSVISSETTILNLGALPLIIEASNNSIDSRGHNSFKIRHYSDFYRSRNHVSYGLKAIQRLKQLIARDEPRLARTSAKDREDFGRAYMNWKSGEVPCKVPKATVVKVREVHPSATIQYDPECTVLHRCSDSVGCCKFGGHCTADTTEEILVYFFAIRPGMDAPFAQALPFQNHTSCACKRKIHQSSSSIRKRADVSNSRSDKWHSDIKIHQHHPKRCRKCPLPFTSRTYKDGRHSCDCFDRQKSCLKIKRGNEAISDSQLRCIENRHCCIPYCEFGNFDLSTGYCPRKPHRRRNRTANDRSRLHRRWALIERE